MIDPAILDQLKAIVGPNGYWDDPADMAPRLVEGRGRYQGATPLVLRPSSTDEVSAILALCNEARVAIVPQGGNTGMVGGQTPPADGSAILLALDRMQKIRATDPLNNTIAVDAGLTLKAVQDQAEAVDRLFPLSLGSEGTAQIGGVLSTNAGGTAVLRYGNARDLALGLEVVLADGRVLDTMTGLRKDNTGYDLRDLFVGAEGTLGIITGAVLKLFPRPADRETMMVAIDNPHCAVKLLAAAQSATGGQITAFEIMPRLAVDFATKHIEGVHDPFAQAHHWMVLVEAESGQKGSLRPALETFLEAAMQDGLARDAVRAESLDQARALWAIRDAIPPAQTCEGGSIKHDVSVPVSVLPDFIAEASEAVTGLVPGARVCAFGHIGDGNVHFNVSQPVDMDKDAFLSNWERMQDVVHAIVARFGGSISAEHGIGQMKVESLQRYKHPVALDVMRSIKQTLDPNAILNPGKLLPRRLG